MDETAFKTAAEHALQTYKPGFNTFFLARLLGLDIGYQDDACRISLPVHDFAYNPQGSLHGGVIAIVMDIAMGHLLHHTLGVSGATLEMKLQYLQPVRAPAASCTARFIRKGRSICFMEAQLHDSAGTLAVVATATWRVNQPAKGSIA